MPVADEAAYVNGTGTEINIDGGILAGPAVRPKPVGE